MSPATTAPAATDEDLQRADALFRRALADGAMPVDLDVLGYGEISTAVAFTTAAGERLALKRLPSFRQAVDVERYEALFDEYLGVLAERGVEPVPSRLHQLQVDGKIVVYCVQPALDAGAVGPAVLGRTNDPNEQRRHLDALFATFERVVDERVGLDGQLSNWALVDGSWRYLDVTTPLLRDERGRDRLDVDLDSDLFLAMLPRILRPAVRRWLLPSITGTYHDARSVVVDFLGNLIKERLEPVLLVGLGAAAGRFDPPITEPEVRRTYRRDSRLWEWLLRLRRADRWWHRRVLRRTYPFLLPGRIAR